MVYWCGPGETGVKGKNAFRLMQYQKEKQPDAAIEWIWNSREGVTPFYVSSRTNDGPDLQHINWQDDILALQYVPNIGQRVFIDLTEEKAREYVQARVDREWDKDGEWSMQKQYESKDKAFESLFAHAMESVERGGPDIIVVNEESQREFVRQVAGH